MQESKPAQIRVNGQWQNLEASQLSSLLVQWGYQAERVAIELNGDILPRARYHECELKNGDQLEIVHFVGGG